MGGILDFIRSDIGGRWEVLRREEFDLDFKRVVWFFI